MSEKSQGETPTQRVARPQQETRPARSGEGEVIRGGKGMVSIDGVPVVFAPYDPADVIIPPPAQGNVEPAQGNVEPAQGNASANEDQTVAE
jgi:hypothetical protein